MTARQDILAAVAGGPFDPADLEVEPDLTPSLVDADNASPARPVIPTHGPQADLRRMLDAAANPPPAPMPTTGKFDPGDRPRIVDGLVVPARSVADHPLATWVLFPVSEIAAVGVTAKAVGVTPKTGRWLAVWVGEPGERDAVLEDFANLVADARKFRR